MVSEAQREQREQAARKHGVRAIRARGEAAMTPEQRSATAQLRDQLSTREGAVEALKDAAVNTVMLANVAQSYVVERHRAGDPLDAIPLLRSLPAFWNSAGRAIKAYIEAMPDEQARKDITELLVGDNGD